MRKLLYLAAAGFLATATFGTSVVASAADQNTCAPNPALGSTLDGGLLVTGFCTLANVTVNGGVTITPTGHLDLENSTVNGGIDVQPGGELDSGHLSDSATATFAPSTINGGINATGAMDMDLDNATVRGVTSIDGFATPGFAPSICGSTFEGSVKISNVVADPTFPMLLGDPGEFVQFGPHPDCPGNTINGSLFISTSAVIEIEGNQIAGSVHISGSTVEFAGNTIGGSAQCDTVVSFTDGDDTANTTGGSNNCL